MHSSFVRDKFTLAVFAPVQIGILAVHWVEQRINIPPSLVSEVKCIRFIKENPYFHFKQKIYKPNVCLMGKIWDLKLFEHQGPPQKKRKYCFQLLFYFINAFVEIMNFFSFTMEKNSIYEYLPCYHRGKKRMFFNFQKFSGSNAARRIFVNSENYF